ncbi:unnamed protein product [Plutella xylostella]|uniref:(diamondback moth) hypothetical protein n=1 Tax=Plutella xylostella TaxID=51655 RepID=A0A8S4G5L9_PLUXY|nr:unnamed protein product [Plutella xylostella]
MGTNGNGRRGGTKLTDLRRPMEEGDCVNDMESPELDFVYDDCDSQANEIAELYSYTEHPEFQLNVKAFEDVMEEFGFPPSWGRLARGQQAAVVERLLEQLDVALAGVRLRAARCVLYLAQGCWAEAQSDAEQQRAARANIMQLYEMGVFTAFVELLNLEIVRSSSANASRKLAETLAESTNLKVSTNLRVILSVLYLITEHMRTEKDKPDSEFSDLVKNFKEELGTPFGDELLPVKLLSMVAHLCAGTTPHFPMKKVLLLLWKILLVFLGGSKELKARKADLREKAGLPPLSEDTLEIIKGMRASSPPPSAADMLENQNPAQRKMKESERALRRQTFMKQTSLDESDEQIYVDKEETGNGSEDYSMEFQDINNTQNPNNCAYYMYFKQFDSPPPPPPLPRSLPWQSKVRQRDIDMFLEIVRVKFVGYSLPGDRSTIAGLPQPIHEGIEILKKHMYTSLSELQIDREMEIARSPLTRGEKEVVETEAEILYKAMLPNLPQYMIALLKILLAAAPTSTAKNYSINIMADILPEEMPMTVLQSLKLGIDINRHKEIIVKAVTAILLLLLKHFKLNHIYQFEFMSQHLVYANCMPLVLKFFNQNPLPYVGAKNNIPIFDFPACVIGEQPELTKECLDIGETGVPYSWRNVFSCINLLRILNKLTKWKNARIMMLVVFKSAPILKRTLKVRHALMQFYVLKLLKMQTKYLGRQWRKTNMKTISAIYSKVRHRLNDDWAFGNDVDARPWDFQDEECALRLNVDRFNSRRYGTGAEQELDLTPVDTDLNSIMETCADLEEEFKDNYELWLDQEVYNNEINWDVLITA